MDSTAHFMEADADLEKNQPSGVESIEMQIPLKSKYGSPSAVSNVYSYFFGCIAT